MTTRHQNRISTWTPELSLSDSEDSYSSSDEEMPTREETDQLLRQAHHYVITEGGKDSASLYMERIQRINWSLVHEISRHGYDCDPKLYRRVKQKVDHVLREFEDAVGVDSGIHDYDEMVEHYATAPEETLRRTGSSPVTPNSPSARVHTKRGGDDDMQRPYLYGGSDSNPEIWHKNSPASLLFPKTIRMAEWESLKTRWDIATTGDMESKDPVALNGVSYNHPDLEHLNYLSQFESGSRFTLPVVDPTVEAKVNDFCTLAKLTKAVDAFSQSNDCRIPDGEYEYAPRVFLERLEVGQQASPTDRQSPQFVSPAYALADRTIVINDVREALNTTPSKPNQASSSVFESDPSSTAEVEEHDNCPLAISPPVSKPPQLLAPAAKPSPQRYGTASAAICRIKIATEASIQTSALPQSPTLVLETCQPLAIKKACGGPRANLLPVSPQPNPLTYQRTAVGKRKRLSVDVLHGRSPTETLADTVPSKRARIAKEPARPYTPILTRQPDSLLTPVTTPALSVGSTTSSSVASTPPVAKARTAGKKQRMIRTKNDFEERVTPEKYVEIMLQRKNAREQGYESIERGSMRSGKRRAM